MVRTRSFTPLQGLLLIAVLVAACLAMAGTSMADDRGPRPPMPTDQVPVFEDGTWRTEKDNASFGCVAGADGDMGNECFFQGDQVGGTIEFNIEVDPVKAGPYKLTIRAYDVDSGAGENDEVRLNGIHDLGPLVGSNDAWSLTTFDVPAAWVETGDNCVEVRIDTGNGGWCTNVSFGTLRAQQPPVPGVNPYGLGAATLLLLAAGIWTVRKRRVYEA